MVSYSIPAAASAQDGACAACNRKKLEPALVNNEPEWIEQYSNSVNTAHYMGFVLFGTNVFT